MVKTKTYDNGLRLVVNTTEGLFSVSCGVIVNTGSRNEEKSENGLSHFIEHTVFKGTTNRSSFEISDFIDSIGAQINAFTSKELTCFYTKSTREHAEESLDVLSDILFNPVFDKEELEKEKGVIIEEINMCEDTPEDICFDLLSKSGFGENGLGQTILGTAKNVKSFSKSDAVKYMDKYYTADNIVISISGNMSFSDAEKAVKKLFADKFTRLKSNKDKPVSNNYRGALYRTKKTEQTHIAFSFPVFSVYDKRSDALSVANTVLGGGMSSRLFQKIREDLGLCYTVYSSVSQYVDCGVTEIYAGVTTEERDNAAEAIINEIRLLNKNGITEKEFNRGREQIKSAFIMGRESTSTQMLLYGKYLLLFGCAFDFEDKIKRIEKMTLDDVNSVIKEYFKVENMATATLGPKRSPIKIIR